jgi:hypothetical protein
MVTWHPARAMARLCIVGGFRINVIIAVAGDIAAILGSKKLVAPLITETTSSE